ncbi:MAG: hypothetical protein KIT22_04340 [Verrucomicrobiae bacterium]|nr:hypothetical protein [Verrucomicrobiae bacterium]
MANFLQPLSPLFLTLTLTGAACQMQAQALFSDDFETDSSANWDLFVGYYSDEPNPNDYTVDWAFDYSTQKYKRFSDDVNFVEEFVPPAPGSDGTTRGVKIRVNQGDDYGSRFAVNLYPKDKTFSGDYVLSFDVWLNYNGPAEGGSGSTEHAIFGINHTGKNVNWTSFGANFTDPAGPNALPPGIGASASDGRWFAMTGEGGAAIDMRSVVGTGNGAPRDLFGAEGGFFDRDGDGSPDNSDLDPWLTTVFPQPKFETEGAPGKRWVHVEVSQIANVITWTIDNSLITTYTNTTGEYTSGTVMIGYMDIFNSIPNPAEDNWGLFDNVRVDSIRTVVVDTTDNASTPGDGKTSLLEALTDLQDHDRIHFNIPGDGPHVIATPIGGYPPITKSGVVIDGYTQPGAVPNSNPILGGNNAQLKIVLDSSSDATANNPENPELPLRASTRLPYSGYGDSENAILPILAADNVTIRGLSFLSRYAAGSNEDPSIYGIALIQGALNTKVQGNWFGLAPDGTTVKGSAAGVTGFRYRVDLGAGPVDTFSEHLTVGTDSDGLGDNGEFNIFAGQHIALGIELPYLTVAGNYFNVLPDGKTFLDVNQIYAALLDAGADDNTVENIENGRLTSGTVIGVNGDGVNDANERNIFNYAVYETLTEFYSEAQNTRISGNYYGVGVDGTSKAPPVSPDNQQPNFLSLPGNATILIGSNFDGVSDDLEGNRIVGVPGSLFVDSGATVPIIARANSLSGNQFTGFPFEDGSNQRSYETYYETVVTTPLTPAAELTAYENGILTGKVASPVIDNYQIVNVDIYLADPLAPEGIILPGEYLGTFGENLPEDDGNLTPDEFAFDLSALNVPGGQQLVVVASYQKQKLEQEIPANPGEAIISPVSNAIPTGGSAPIGAVTVAVDGDNLRLTWTGGTGPYQVQSRAALSSGAWADAGSAVTETTAVVPIPASGVSFYQIVGQ